MDEGRVEGIFIGPPRTLPAPVERIRAVAGRGLEGNRHFYETAPPGQALTLIQAEALEGLEADTGIQLTAAESRRNVLTRGIDLNALVGKRFRVGDVECEGVELCEPCTSLQGMTYPGVIKGLVHRGGLNADILSDGEIAVGDSVEELYGLREPVTVACVQAEPVVLDRAATIDKLARLTAEAAAAGAGLVVFPETFVAAYPSSVWAKAFAGWVDPGAKAAFARLADQAVAVGSPDERRLGEIAREHGVWLVTGVNEVDPARNGTIYNALLYHSPDGTLALHHRKLVPTNHERLVWGPGDGSGLRALETPIGRIGGLICWENYMPLARFALYESGLEIYVASTADDGDAWQSTLIHLARESRSFIVAPSHFQRASAYPDDFPLGELIADVDVIGRGGSAILAPDGSYLAGPLYDEEGILYAELEPARLREERQRFDPAGHYHRPDLLRLTVGH